MNPRPLGQPRRSGIMAGLRALARGDASGLAQFGHTPRAFLASLVPLIALPVAVALITLGRGAFVRALADLAAAVCVLLVPPVISHALAVRWQRTAWWLRFAVAFNWCQFGLSVLCMALLIALGIVLGATGQTTVTDGIATAVVALCLTIVGYGLWLHWFVARNGLNVSGGRAALLVFATYAGTFAVLVLRGMLLMDRG
jgi:hypothetical protein